MTPVERMARGIYQDRNGPGCKAWGHLPGSHIEPYLCDAHAALKAIREPSEAMIEAGVTAATGKTLGERVANAHRAMIDAALSET